MTLFVYIGAGTAVAVGAAQYTGISMSFGFAITALVYMTAHTSGGHVNCAVTFALCLAGLCEPLDGVMIAVVQFAGSVLGALLIAATFKEENDMTGGLGTNAIADGVGYGNAWCGEIVMTYLLCTVVFATAVNENAITRNVKTQNPMLAPVAIGFSVFLAHQVLIAVDGCSINPTRTFGPAVVGSFRHDKTFNDFEVFMVGPLVGAAIAALQYRVMKTLDEKVDKEIEMVPATE